MVVTKSTGHLLKHLRQLMINKHCISEVLSAYIIPSSDNHQSEYLAPCDKRRDFISGFTGSAGSCIVTADKALLWTDGRYFLQAEKELDQNWTLMKDGVLDVPKQEVWLSKNLPKGSVVGVDPYLLSLDSWRRISQELKKGGQSLVRVDKNLIDIVWQEHYCKPEKPLSDLIISEEHFSGKSWQTKVKETQELLASKQIYAVVIAALDEVAWLFNLRGADINYNPVFMSYAIVTLHETILFIDEDRVTSNIRKHLLLDDESAKIKILPYGAIQENLRDLGSLEKKVWISSKSSCALASLVPEPYLVTDISPVCKAKAIKNKREIEGMKAAHIRDGAALCEFLCWIESEVVTGTLDEFNAATKLDELRRQEDNFVSLSFETISGSGPNGAIIHYRVQEDSARAITPDDMYLCDSGAQYLDGTTDVTRTIHLGVPAQYQKECFTRVLKGHISLAMATFPRGTRGHILDVLARKPLWDCGLDYPHGTGHGVGAFLNVHEGPISMSPRQSDDQALEPGMFITDEPGYYEDGCFGIRIENVLLVKEVQLKRNFQNKGYLGFEPVTLAPIQRKLLLPEMLTSEEIQWLNEYHELVLEKVGEHLKDRGKTHVLKWLVRETEKLG